MDKTSEIIIKLLYEWFPFLEQVVQNGGTVYGGVLREMWLAACLYRPQTSLSFEDTIKHHMLDYFKRGGDVDFTTDIDHFSTLFGISLDIDCNEKVVYSGKPSYPTQFSDTINNIKEIKAIETKYDLGSILKRVNRNLKYEKEEYGDDNDSDYYKQKTFKELFPSRHFIVTTLVEICPNVIISVSMDMITYYRFLKPENHCDFGCNLLVLKTEAMNPIVTLKFTPANCSTIKDFDAQIRSKKILILPDQTVSATKLLYRLVKRLESGWLIDKSDKITMDLLVKYFVSAISMGKYSHDDRDIPESQIEEKKMHSEFFMAKGVWILKIFKLCRQEMKEFIVAEIKRYRDNNRDTIKTAKTHYDLIGYSCEEIMTFIQDLCVRHGHYLEFKEWSKDIQHWDIKLSHSLNLCSTVAYQPELIAQMFKECPFQKNTDAINFMCALIEYDREELLLKYLDMPSGKKTITLFNSLSDDKKCECKLISGFFCSSYSYSSSITEFKPRYLQILNDHGLILPRFEKKRYNDKGIVYQSTELIQILWHFGVIDKSDLFPIYPKKDNWEPDPDCILATGSNIKWLLSVIHINKEEIDRMLTMHNKYRKNLDFEFLFEYKKFCQDHRFEPDPLDNIFIELFKNNDWINVRNYFIYRFDCEWPTMDQIFGLVVSKDSGMYYSRTSRVISLSSVPYSRNDGRDQLLPGKTPTVFQRLVLNYGPHLFTGIFDNIAPERTRYDWEREDGLIPTNPCVADNPMELWFVTVYWLWRIANNPDLPIVAARQLPREVINIIVLYILHNTDGYKRNRMSVSIGWNSKVWNEFRSKIIKK